MPCTAPDYFTPFISPVEVDNRRNLETFTLIWLEFNINIATNDIHFVQKKLRQAINRIITFNDISKLDDWLQKDHGSDKIVLIISGGFEREWQGVIERSNNVSRLVYVYIFSEMITVDFKETFVKVNQKIRAVISDQDELICLVKLDQQELEKLEDVMSLPMNIYDVNAVGSSLAKENSSTSLNGNFLWFQLFIEVFLRMEHTATDFLELVNFCKEIYMDNTSQLEVINEFQQNYTYTRAVFWYSREIFLYKILNKALRCQNLETLIAFRTFINDLCNQLQNLKEDAALRNLSKITRVYRGQLMSNTELERIQSSTSSYISMNSFLSTTVDRDLALFLIESAATSVSAPVENALKPVLFDIEIDPSSSRNVKPFADISSQSYFQTEKEVLFMIGSVFKIEKVTKVADDRGTGSWTINLLLCSSKEHQLEQLVSYLNDKITKYKPKFIAIAHLLTDMGEYRQAEKYYQRQLDELGNIDEKNAKTIASCYTGLGTAAHYLGDYNLAISYHEKALNIHLMIPNSHEELSICYNWFANAFADKKEYEKALDYYNKSLKINEMVFGLESVDVAMIYYNIGILYTDQSNYEDALTYLSRALEIREKWLPPNHYSIARTIENIGFVYFNRKDHQSALTYFQRSLEIFMKSETEMHQDLALLYHRFGRVYVDLGKIELALDYFTKADKIYRSSLLPTTPYVIENQQYLDSIINNLN
ncbi:unnamed protein product [Rotaria socialis]|uniref:Uncharacterized protein n=1 Tax=Rotaria socialis TaxID=392032 RepID=A0A818NEY9_9BILA|nr:unnamed protein product [Rotaria socialis]CAF4560289.1 unnamed protein product [Rotaria socialis]